MPSRDLDITWEVIPPDGVFIGEAYGDVVRRVMASRLLGVEPVRAPDFRVLLPKGQHVLHADRMDWEVDPDVLRPVAMFVRDGWRGRCFSK